MILIQAQSITKSFSSRSLFTEISLTIESGEKIGLIGPNGAGKSTLLKILAQEESPDSGTVTRSPGIRVGFLKQVPTFKPGHKCLEALLEPFSERERGDSMIVLKAHEVLSRLELDPEVLVETLSGGWKKRVALGRELVKDPDLLLLDEPTNHLDVETIEFLEQFLSQSRIAIVTITHDRHFLDEVSDRVMELDRRNPKGLLSVKGGYSDFVVEKEAMLARMESTAESLKNILRRETEWLRRGAKARTTKQQARIKRAGTLKDDVEALSARLQNKTLDLDFHTSDRRSKKLIAFEDISYGYPNKPLVKGLSLSVTAGKKIALQGPNGCGKSTLIRILAGQIKPHAGVVKTAPDLQVALFEQNRDALDPELTVMRTLCPTGDTVHFQGRPLHIRSYLDRFLFDREHADVQVKKLSGGEQSRILIAQLMLRPADILILDEPTNDLDLATLSLLEQNLVEFPGAVIFVSHDRWFTEQVATDYFVPHPDTKIWSHFSSMDQVNDFQKAIFKAQKKSAAAMAGSTTATAAKNALSPSSAPVKYKKLSYKDQRELDLMEETLLKLETELESLNQKVDAPETQSDHKKLLEASQAAASKASEIDQLYTRWAELEDMRKP